MVVLDRPPLLWGIDDAALYRKLRGLDTGLRTGKESWTRPIEQLAAALHSDGLKHVSSDYRAFCHACSAGGDDFPPVEVLIDYANRLGLVSNALRNYNILVRARDMERAIDFEAMDHEREALQNLIVSLVADPERLVQTSFEAAGLLPADATAQSLMMAADAKSSLAADMRHTPLGRVLLPGMRNAAAPDRAPTELLSLFERSYQSISGELTGLIAEQSTSRKAMARLFNFLMELMTLLDIGQERFPNLVRYAHSTNRWTGAQGFLLIDEIFGLKGRIQAALTRNDADRVHASLSERLRLLLSACRLMLTRREVKQLQGMAGEMSHRRLLEDLRSLLPDGAALRELRDLEEDYAARFEDTMLYYNVQDLRADAMVANTLARIRESGQNSAILVTGGFHEETISAGFARNRVSHTVVFANPEHHRNERRQKS
jgi:hypothetical protein